MLASELFEDTGNHRLTRLLDALNSLCGVTINFTDNDDETLKSVMEEFISVKQQIVRESQFNNYHVDPEYTKACLIAEAIRIYLREIAPKRIRRRRQKTS